MRPDQVRFVADHQPPLAILAKCYLRPGAVRFDQSAVSGRSVRAMTRRDLHPSRRTHLQPGGGRTVTPSDNLSSFAWSYGPQTASAVA